MLKIRKRVDIRLIFLIILIWFFLDPNSLKFVIELSNQNEGVIGIVGILIALFGIVLPKNKEKNNQKKNQELLQKSILLELWQNMNFAYQIEVIHRNNIGNGDNSIYIPKYPPRYYILEKILTPENLRDFTDIKLGKNKKSQFNTDQLLEIYAQTKMIDKEFDRWQNRLASNLSSENPENNRNIYEEISSKLLELVEVFMKNSIGMWLQLLEDEKTVKRTGKDKLINLSKTITEYYKNGRHVAPCYKSSFYKKKENQPEGNKFDIIFCWEDDWIDSQHETIELKDLVPLHDSWKEKSISDE